MPRGEPLLYAGALRPIRELAARSFQLTSREGLYVVLHVEHRVIVFSVATLLRIGDMYSAFAGGRPKGAMGALLRAGLVRIDKLLLLLYCVCHLDEV